MAYATETDLDRVWGRETVDLVTIDAALQGRDADKIAAALDDASAILDSYCARRYPAPFTLTDSGLRLVNGYVCDIAMGRLASTAGRMTEIIKARSDAALQWLRDVAAARADLPVVPSTANGPAAPSISPNEAILEANERFFTRDTLRGY